jgi:hypothetical protein
MTAGWLIGVTTALADSPHFLFSEDEQIAGTMNQAMPALKQDDEVRSDEWLNAPMTRLDYVLSRFEDRGDFVKRSITSALQRSFERESDGITVDYIAGFTEQSGRIVLYVDVEGFGEPHRPLKEMCEQTLGVLRSSFPTNLPIDAWERTALGVLARGRPSQSYADSLRKIVESIVLSANIQALVPNGDKPKVFQVYCREQSATSPTEFFKRALPLK